MPRQMNSDFAKNKPLELVDLHYCFYIAKKTSATLIECHDHPPLLQPKSGIIGFIKTQ